MAVFAAHSVEGGYDVYRLRYKKAWVGYIWALIISLLVLYFSENIYVWYIFLLLILLGFVEFAPLLVKMFGARLSGKAVVTTEKGKSVFGGYHGLGWEIKIER